MLVDLIQPLVFVPCPHILRCISLYDGTFVDNPPAVAVVLNVKFSRIRVQHTAHPHVFLCGNLFFQLLKHLRIALPVFHQSELRFHHQRLDFQGAVLPFDRFPVEAVRRLQRAFRKFIIIHCFFRILFCLCKCLAANTQ